MAETTAYSCPQCGGALKLDPGSGKLTCEFCDGIFEPEQIESRVEEISAARKKAEARAEKVKPKKKKNKIPERDLSVMENMRTVDISEWDEFRAAGEVEQFDEVVGYTCRNCGAQVVTDKLTVATSCQYCGSSVVVDERVTGGMKPGYVIPFKIKAADLPKKLTQFYSKRPLLPEDFFYKNQVGEVQGLYVPFWLYNGTVAGRAHLEGTSSRSWREGDYDVTETTYYESEREGTVRFGKVPVDGSARIDDDLMDSIEPFHYDEMKEFQAAYLTGFVAERFDQSPMEVFDRASDRMKKTATTEFKNSTSYRVSSHTGTYDFSDASVSYVLMPVYLFNCRYGGKRYRYAVNGQTGEIVGEVPSSAKKAFVEFLKGFAKGFIIALIVAAILYIMCMDV